MGEYDAFWRDMETAPSHPGAGLLRRRIEADSKFDLYVAVEKPTNHRALFLDVDEFAIKEVGQLPTLRSILVRLSRGGGAPDRVALELSLTNRAYEEIFSVLVEDLVRIVLVCSTEKEAVEASIHRLERWQFLLTRSGPEGLSEEAQRGLFGELWFMNEYLLPLRGGWPAVSSWTGPDRANQDFQLPEVAVEVKTTIMKQPQFMMIASERQLDDTGVEALYLFYLSLDARQDSPRTLGAVIDTLRHTLDDHAPSRSLFEESLLAAGYLDAHRGRYDRVGYTVRESDFFHVRDGFPRLTEADLPAGVGDIRYSVAVSECSRFIVCDTVFARLLGVGNRDE